MPEFVMLDDLDTYIVRTMEKVHSGVAESRKLGIQAELPPKVDFDVVVIAAWQSLQVSKSDREDSRETGGTTEIGTSKESTTGNDSTTTEEKQGGYQTETSRRSSTETQTGTDKKTTEGRNDHAQNTDETITTN